MSNVLQALAAVALILIGCAGEPAIEAPTVKVRGDVIEVSVPPSGDATFRIKLRDRDPKLPSGMTQLRCRVVAADRTGLAVTLENLSANDSVTVVGELGPVGDEPIAIRRVGLIMVF